jgi:hypothetical protein
MKLFYSRPGRIIVTAVLFITLNTSVKAQTTLVLGDIAFTGIITGGTDQFSFVLLRSITNGTLINFTDNGWLGTNAFRGGEQNILFTSIALPAGREILINGLTATQAGNGMSAGTVTGSVGGLNLSTTADQIFAFQGTIASPILITGIHMGVNVLTGLPCQVAELFENTDATNWDGSCANSSNNSWKPPALNGAGTTAFWIGVTGNTLSERDNAVFNCTGPLGTVAQVKAALANQANWITSDGVPAFILGSNCAFLGLFPLPVQLISFTGKLNSDKTVTLQWKVADQQDAQEFTVEESADGSSYRTLGTVIPGAGDTYSLVDAQVATGKNYYRLKTLELSGKITYSNVIVINLKAGIVISLYPNPVTDKLTIQQFGTIQNKKAILADQQGRVVQHISLTNLQQTVNMERYAAGIYTLKLEDGTTYKIVKE